MQPSYFQVPSQINWHFLEKRSVIAIFEDTVTCFEENSSTSKNCISNLKLSLYIEIMASKSSVWIETELQILIMIMSTFKKVFLYNFCTKLTTSKLNCIN